MTRFRDVPGEAAGAVADPFDLTDQIAVITGGGTGIGRATAHLLAERGAHVVLASRRVENLERVAAEVRERGRRALVVPTDVRRPEDCQELATCSSGIRPSASSGRATCGSAASTSW